MSLRSSGRSGFRLWPAALAALVLALVIQPVMAQSPVAIRDSVPASSVEGTIFSVEGSIVSILDGLVKIDLSSATAADTGAPGGAQPPLPGERIFAFLKSLPGPNGVLVAEKYTVLQQRPGSLSGVLEAIDEAARTITVLGLTIRTDADTSFDGATATANAPSLGDLRVGQPVFVELAPKGGALFATRVLVLSPIPNPEVRFEGTVKQIGPDSWTISVPPDRRAMGPAASLDVVVKIDARTKITGEPKVGDRVGVRATAGPDGTLTALSIEKQNDPSGEVQRFTGVVKSIGPEQWTIGPPVGDGPDRLVRIDASTRFVGDPKVGDTVLVVAEINAAGIPLAKLIQKLDNPFPDAVTLVGMVKTIGAEAWVITFPSFTTPPAEATILVNPQTRISGDPKVGDTVRVRATRNGDGTYTAREIERVGSPQPEHFTFVGFVRAITNDVWTISASPLPETVPDLQIRVTSSTRFEGSPKVGDAVKVEVRRTGSNPGELVAISIVKVDVVIQTTVAPHRG